jgi:hypothetical protein
MDASDDLISWAQKNQFGFLDLNVFSNATTAESNDSMVAINPLTSSGLFTHLRQREMLSLQRKVITYVWDNFIEYEDALWNF